jgi:hypothetical protein
VHSVGPAFRTGKQPSQARGRDSHAALQHRSRLLHQTWSTVPSGSLIGEASRAPLTRTRTMKSQVAIHSEATEVCAAAAAAAEAQGPRATSDALSESSESYESSESPPSESLPAPPAHCGSMRGRPAHSGKGGGPWGASASPSAGRPSSCPGGPCPGGPCPGVTRAVRSRGAALACDAGTAGRPGMAAAAAPPRVGGGSSAGPARPAAQGRLGRQPGQQPGQA